MHTRIAVTSALVLLLALATGFWASRDTSEVPMSAQEGAEKSTNVPDGWVAYENPGHRFSFAHPPGLSVKEYDEGNNSVTLVFSENGSSRSFQIFITPYTEDHITSERFSMDAPSGVIENPVEVVIGGSARGSVFDGEHALLGKTREVWFIHGGFLFEVTTYRDLDAWISEIMATWVFL